LTADTTKSKFNILLIEDDAADQKLIKSMVEKQPIDCNLCFAPSAEEALATLRAGEKSAKGPAPADLIIVDLNMPGMGGREFLRQIKTDPKLKQIPVVILTSSTSERDIQDSYQLQAAGFLTKPAGLTQLDRIINGIIKYWLVLCRLPTKEY
jgi:CheY-like chemotaxis protein